MSKRRRAGSELDEDDDADEEDDEEEDDGEDDELAAEAPTEAGGASITLCGRLSSGKGRKVVGDLHATVFATPKGDRLTLTQ